MSEQRVGIVGDDGLTGSIDGSVAVPPDETSRVDVVVAVGEGTLVDLVRAETTVPVFPVDAGAGVRSVSRENAATAIESVLADDPPTDRHPVLSVETGEGTVRALFDAGLVTAEPARISEYSIRWRGETVARTRADGVVVSTPAGSVGYNAAADGPIVAPGVEAVSVVPIAPFATDPDRWVLSLEELSLVVERDETPVELLVDGRREGAVSPRSPIRLRKIGVLETIVAAEGGAFF